MGRLDDDVDAVVVAVNKPIEGHLKVHPPDEELKFVVELPDEKQMIFTVDRHQIVDLAEPVEVH